MTNLPKWPEMRTSGVKITPKQARAIILKTDRSFNYLNCNDQEWVKIVAEILGLKYNDKHPHIDWDALESVRKGLGHLELEYIGPDRIMTSYVGGPHGWINWNGNIGESGHNIGKWPEVETVLEDWKKVAAAFPFLNMRCQLFDKEGCEGGVPVIEYSIKDGNAEIVELGEVIPPAFRDSEAEIARLFTVGAERGIDVETLKLAIKEVKG